MNIRPFLGVNVSPVSADEIRFRGIIEEDEKLLALFDGVLLDENRRRIGGVALSDFVVLTDRRLVTWARGLFNDSADGFRWEDVDIVRAETWDPWHGRVILAFRLTPIVPRKRRISVKGTADTESGDNERVIANTLDYMPTDDVTNLSKMVEWVGDQVVNGLSGDALARAFAEMFPAPEHKSLMIVEPPPPPPEPPRQSWWSRMFGKKKTEESDLDPHAATSNNLIAAYESRRGGNPNTAMVPHRGNPGTMMPIRGPGSALTNAIAGGSGSMPLLPEQPSMYELSRTLRMFLEAPGRMAESLRRASEAVGGASEMVTGMQDPKVRRNAMRGLYMAAAQQEAENGPLARVAPVVRAAVRFAEPLEEDTATESARRNIQVRARVRRQTPDQIPAADAAAPIQLPTPAEPTITTGSVRRSVNVRRVDLSQPASQEEATPTINTVRRVDRAQSPSQEEATPTINTVRRVDRAQSPSQPEADPAANPDLATPPAGEAPRAPVRRIVVNRASDPSSVSYQPAVVSNNGNGKHDAGEGAE